MTDSCASCIKGHGLSGYLLLINSIIYSVKFIIFYGQTSGYYLSLTDSAKISSCLPTSLFVNQKYVELYSPVLQSRKRGWGIAISSLYLKKNREFWFGYARTMVQKLH